MTVVLAVQLKPDTHNRTYTYRFCSLSSNSATRPTAPRYLNRMPCYDSRPMSSGYAAFNALPGIPPHTSRYVCIPFSAINTTSTKHMPQNSPLPPSPVCRPPRALHPAKHHLPQPVLTRHAPLVPRPPLLAPSQRQAPTRFLPLDTAHGYGPPPSDFGRSQLLGLPSLATLRRAPPLPSSHLPTNTGLKYPPFAPYLRYTRSQLS